jgi:hypothetical protein
VTANPRYDPEAAQSFAFDASGFLARTTTGGQLDDDADGHGNACDPDFDQSGVVGYEDLISMFGADGRSVLDENCELAPGVLIACDVFDLNGRLAQIGGPTEDSDWKLLTAPLLGNPVPVTCPTCPLTCVGDACDADSDGFRDGDDSCPTIASASQSDSDSDGVGDLCDSCVNVANPRRHRSYLTENVWATLTGGQRDDDVDGYGNVCDANFPGSLAVNVTAADLALFKASIGRDRETDTCGTPAGSGTLPCAIFDLDEGTAMGISAADTARFKLLIGAPPGPRCASCPLECESGPAGACP